MKYPKNKKNSRGVSIIEIVVSMVLLFLVMLVLAFVYPNGRRVTQSSDYRTKATEIAKSIMEEIQLIPLYPQNTSANQSALASVSLVGNVDGDFTLNELTFDDMKTFRWPYHQLITSVDADNDDNGVSVWDADKDKNTNARCPFFIYNGNGGEDLREKINSNKIRPFFISINELADMHLPKGIVVTPENNVYKPNARIPVIATVTVSVCWGYSANSKTLNYNYVQLLNTRTENIY